MLSLKQGRFYEDQTQKGRRYRRSDHPGGGEKLEKNAANELREMDRNSAANEKEVREMDR